MNESWVWGWRILGRLCVKIIFWIGDKGIIVKDIGEMIYIIAWNWSLHLGILHLQNNICENELHI